MPILTRPWLYPWGCVAAASQQWRRSEQVPGLQASCPSGHAAALSAVSRARHRAQHRVWHLAQMLSERPVILLLRVTVTFLQ